MLEDEDVIISPYPLSASQLLLRDSKLQNTEYAYGVVVYTGPDTKVVRNFMTLPFKWSKVEIGVGQGDICFVLNADNHFLDHLHQFLSIHHRGNIRTVVPSISRR